VNGGGKRKIEKTGELGRERARRRKSAPGRHCGYIEGLKKNGVLVKERGGLCLARGEGGGGER